MKLNVKRTILVGLAFMSITAFWQMYDNIIPLILKNSFNLNEVFIGIVMAMDNVLALFMLPYFGSLSDRVSTKMGKRVPFILGGTIVANIAMIFMPYADNKRKLVLFLIMTGIVLLAMAVFRSPAVALMPDVTPRLLRSKGNAVVNLLGAAGGVVTLILIGAVVGDGDTPDYSMLFYLLIIFMFVSTIVLTVFVKENKWENEAREIDKGLEEEGVSFDTQEEIKALPAEKKRSLVFLLISVAMWYMAYNAVTTAFSRYATKVWGNGNGSYASYLMIATVVAIISYIPIGILAGKIGRKKTILIGIGGLAIGFAVCGLMQQASIMAKLMFGLIGISWAAINVNSFPMVVEIASDGDEGKFTGYYYSFSMAAQILTPILSGAFLQYVSYYTLFPYAVFFSIVAIFTMMQVKHGDVIEVSEKSMLEHFDVDS